jgi:hypothetical protein
MPNPVVARLTSPAQVVAVLPHYLGYVPAESLVVVCLDQPRGRLGLTMRFDLPLAAHEADLVEQVVGRVRRQRASRVLLAVYTAEPDLTGLPRTLLVDSVLDALPGVEAIDALLVRGERFWSYLCRSARCCPPEGRPVDQVGLEDEQVGLLAAELVLQGRVTMPSREALEESIAGPVGRAADAAGRSCGSAFEDLRLAREAGERDAYIEQLLVLWAAAALRFSLPRPELHPDDAASLAVSLGDKLLRDVVATRFDVPGMRELLAELCRRTPAPWDVPVCTLLAWAAYCEGGGAEVTIALERALASEPGYELAVLLRDALLSQAHPELIRQITRDVAADERVRRWVM